MAWMTSGKDTGAGGTANVPPSKGFCAKCLRRRLVSDMQIENDGGPADGYYVCSGTRAEGGCYKGPYPFPNDMGVEDDDVSPIPGLMHLGRGD